MKTCLDCGAHASPEQCWCPACSSTALSLDMPRLIPVCNRCLEHWPERLTIAQERGIPVSLLCAAHLAEMRDEAADRVAVVA